MSRMVDILTAAIIWGHEGAPLGDVVKKLKELETVAPKYWSVVVRGLCGGRLAALRSLGRVSMKKADSVQVKNRR